ncbi:M48 family metallopeptidase [Nocardioides sp.]|uniref:M48 family metallopeptidase n=1 Tax=Nocardioides sp. TaxID=35761 RepID=UPI002BA44295|nr:M48 family metalloprotease [Nocardioides sp.]HSX69278.1 M48 family metalloprotease [Nocardioides sp.]
MKHTTRALLALALLVGFYVFALAIVLGLVWGAVALTKAGVSGYALGKLWIFALVIGYVVIRALFGRRKKAKGEPPGMLLTETAQPALWSEVRAIADFAGTRAPDEIRLVPEVNAAVSEEAKWLGLISGTRRMYLGVPLLLGLSRDQLRSVLAHELGHYSGKHTALGAITYRGQEAIARVLTGLGDSWTAKLFSLYARLYYAVSHTVSRRQELEADRLSAALVGSDIAAGALRELRPIDSAWGFYLDAYADLGSAVGHRPTDLYEGFAAFLASPTRQEQLAEVRADASEGPRSVFDSHPPTSERVRQLQAIGQPSAADTSGPAISLMAPGTLVLAQDALWEGDRRAAAPLEAIVPLVGADTVHHNARVIRAQLQAAGASPDLAGALAIFREGRAADLIRPLHPDGDDDALRNAAGRLTGDLAASQLVTAERAGHRLNWDGDWRFADAADVEVNPWQPAIAAANDPTAVPAFTEWLAVRGVDLEAPADLEVTLPGRDLPPADELLAACAPVGGRYRTLVVLGEGVAVRKAGVADRIAVGKTAVVGNAGKALIKQALKEGVDGLLASPHTTLLRWDEITAATYREKMLDRGVLTFTGAGGEHTVKFIVETEQVGDPVAAIEHFLGDRFSRR